MLIFFDLNFVSFLILQLECTISFFIITGARPIFTLKRQLLMVMYSLKVIFN